MGTDFTQEGPLEFTTAGAAVMTIRDRRGEYVDDGHVLPPDADGPAQIMVGDRKYTVSAAWALARALDLMVSNARGLNGDRFG
jgi:hypothetical protein